MPGTAIQQVDEYFTTDEVAVISGASVRQLQWWDERSVLQPTGGIERHFRLYSASDVLAARILVSLREFGMSLRRAKYALLKIEAEDGRFAAVEYIKGRKGLPRVAVGETLQEAAEAAMEWRRPVVFVDREITGDIADIV